jgi:hypothetical protein
MKMEYKYIMLRPDEDCRVVSFLTEKGLRTLLDDPVGYYGVEEFLTEADLKDNTNPMYWKEGQALVIEIKEVLRFKTIATAYRVKERYEE